MSEEFKRSEIGHNANDLHRHGGLDAPEDEKTERESLEDAIEALNDSEETENLVKIEKDMKAENAAAAPKRIDEDNEKAIEDLLEGKEAAAEPNKESSEPINVWKNNKKGDTGMQEEAPVQQKEEKKNGGLGWKIAAIAGLVLAVVGCGLSAFMLFGGDKVELMGRTVTNTKTEKKVASSGIADSNGDINTNFQFDYENLSLNYSSLLKTINPDGGNWVAPNVVDFTKDGKYAYVLADIIPIEGIGGYYGFYYRENTKGSSWKTLQEGHSFISCSEYTDEQKKFMSDYKYIDDNLGSRYIGCIEDITTGKVFPE